MIHDKRTPHTHQLLSTLSLAIPQARGLFGLNEGQKVQSSLEQHLADHGQGGEGERSEECQGHGQTADQKRLSCHSKQLHNCKNIKIINRVLQNL